MLKSRKAAPGGQQNSQAPPPRNPTVAPNNKRYLILTYAAEFDRVHYPLPLLYEEHPDPQHLKSIIGKLRSEVDELQRQQQLQVQQVQAGNGRGIRAAEAAVPAELRRLREDNAVLKQQLRQLERAGGGGPQGGLEAREMARDLRAVSAGVFEGRAWRIAGQPHVDAWVKPSKGGLVCGQAQQASGRAASSWRRTGLGSVLLCPGGCHSGTPWEHPAA